jgi:hypothetical protein
VRWHGVTLYEGRAAEEWIEKLGESRIPNEIFGRSDSRKPIEALRAIGPAGAVPAALTLLTPPLACADRRGADLRALRRRCEGGDPGADRGVPVKDELGQVWQPRPIPWSPSAWRRGPPAPELLKALSDADGLCGFAARVVFSIDLAPGGHERAQAVLRDA